MPANPQPTFGALLIGDAFNMRHAFTGGGMTVALSDIVVLRDLLKPLHDLNDAPSLCKYLESFYTLRKPIACTINTLAEALYKVFSDSPDQAHRRCAKHVLTIYALEVSFQPDQWLCSQSASGIIFPIIKAEGVKQMFFPAIIAALYRAPPAE